MRLKAPYVWYSNAPLGTRRPLGNTQTRRPLRRLVKAQSVAREAHFVLASTDDATHQKTGTGIGRAISDLMN